MGLWVVEYRNALRERESKRGGDRQLRNRALNGDSYAPPCARLMAVAIAPGIYGDTMDSEGHGWTTAAARRQPGPSRWRPRIPDFVSTHTDGCQPLVSIAGKLRAIIRGRST